MVKLFSSGGFLLTLIEFDKECEYCGIQDWCSLAGGLWHCGCLDREEE